MNGAPPDTDVPGDTDPKSVVREYVVAFNDKAIDRLVALHHPDARMWSPVERQGIVGHEAIGASFGRRFEAGPDEVMTIDLLVGDETHCVAELRCVGLGPEREEIQVTQVYEVRNGSISASHAYFDPKQMPALAGRSAVGL